MNIFIWDWHEPERKGECINFEDLEELSEFMKFNPRAILYHSGENLMIEPYYMNKPKEGVL